MMNKPYGASPLQRQRELDAFEEQRQAYNTAMRDYEETAAQQPVANFDAGGEVRKMYLEQTGREPDKEGLEYFSDLYGANINKDELDAFRTMAGQEVVNNDIRKAAAAEQAAAAATANATARQQATTAAAAKKVTDIAAGTAGMEAAAGSVAAGQLAAINQAGATTGQSPAEQQAAAVRQLTAQLAASGQSGADFFGSGGKLPVTAAIAKDLMTRAMVTGVPTAEFDRYGGYKAVKDAYTAAGGKLDLDSVPAETLAALAQTVAKTGVGDLQVLKKTGVPLSTAGYQNMLRNGIDPASAASYMQQFGAIGPVKTTTTASVLPLPGAATNFTGSNLTGVQPVDYASMLTTKPLTFNTSTKASRAGTLGKTTAADYTSKGVGAVTDAGSLVAKSLAKPLFGKKPVRRGAAGSASSYFASAPESLTGLAPGTAALGPIETPLAGGKTTLEALEAVPNLSPGMLGGLENAGYRTDRLGNRIYAPASKPLFGFAKGGDVNLEALSEDESEDAVNTDPVGTAQKMMSDFSSASQANPNVSPTRKAIKQTKPAPAKSSAKSGSAKMAYESLVKGDMGAMGTAAPALKDTDSAQAQMQELARIYRLKAQASQERAKGLSANTFGAPTLEQPTLTKGKLTKKRFKDGGEAKKPEGDEAEPLRSPEEQPVTEESSASRALGAFVSRLKAGKDKLRQNLQEARRLGISSHPSLLDLGYGAYKYKTGTFPLENAASDLKYRLKGPIPSPKDTGSVPVGTQFDSSDFDSSELARRRSKGSPEEGELSQEEIDAASRPAFVTPSSGKGRKEGEISKQLRSGDAYVNMAKGVTELPYDIAGAPMDIAMLVRQGLTGQAPAGQVGTSDYIKEKMTAAGVRPKPPVDSTAKGFYTAGELLSNLANPAGVTRAGVKGAQKVGQAATDVAKDFQEYNRQLSVPGASYAVRPTGSTMLTGPVGLNKDVGEIDQIVQSGISNGRWADQADLIKDFWDKKARNYFTRQFGTPDDPIARGISNKTIKGSALEEMFPEYMIDQIAVGKTRYKEGMTPEGFVGPGASVKDRFFPKYPRAMEDLTKRYDEATGLKGNLITTDPAAADTQYSYISTAGRDMARSSSDLEADKMISQGIDPRLINSQVGAVTRGIKDPSGILSDGTSSAKGLYEAFEAASLYKKLPPERKIDFIKDMTGEGVIDANMSDADISKNLLSENVLTAIEKGEPIYDIGYMRKPLADLFRPQAINAYLASLSPRELANVRFEDAVRGGLKLGERTAQFDNMTERIRAGKPVPDKVFSEGVSKPLLQFDKDSSLEGLEGFAWKRIEKREATVPEGAYVGHSVGGYEIGGPGYTKEKMEGFKTGKYRVYTLRDNRNRPVNTIEVTMQDENTPIVTQIKGNGRATGNVPAAKYDGAILSFLSTYLKPFAISEKDELLTPLLQSYKAEIDLRNQAR